MRRQPLLLCAVTAAACSPAPAPASQAADTAAAAPPARIAFALTSPKAGDTLVEGRTYVIRWMSPDTMRINLGAAMGGKDKGMLLTNAPSTPDSLVWTVPAGFVTGFGPQSSDAVRLRLENAANPDQWTEAGPFTVSGAPR